MIEFRNVTFSYGEAPVVENLSFSIKKGETVGLIGANGAGKSTIMKLMLGLITGFGEIKVDGLPMKKEIWRKFAGKLGLCSRIPTTRCSCPRCTRI